MRATRVVNLGDLSVEVRELTVADVRNLLLTTGQTGDPLQQLVFEDFGLGDLVVMTDTSAAALEEFTPTQLQPLIAACQELNPHFFRVRVALTATARLVQREAEQMALTALAAC